MKRTLLILGAGQYGSVAYEIANAMNCFEKIAFLDDSSERAIGKLSMYAELKGEFTHAVVAIGKTSVRMQWLAKLRAAGYHLDPLIDPRAYVSPTSRIGGGTIIEPYAVVQPNATIGRGCLICSGSVLKHNSHVSDGCYIDANAVVIPRAIVPHDVKVECGKVFG